MSAFRVEPLRNSTSFAVSDGLSGEFYPHRFKDSAHAELFAAVLGEVPDPISDAQIFQATGEFLDAWERVNLGVELRVSELAPAFLISQEYKALLPKEESHA